MIVPQVASHSVRKAYGYLPEGGVCNGVRTDLIKQFTKPSNDDFRQYPGANIRRQSWQLLSPDDQQQPERRHTQTERSQTPRYGTRFFARTLTLALDHLRHETVSKVGGILQLLRKRRYRLAGQGADMDGGATWAILRCEGVEMGTTQVTGAA